jgi:pilus assembly protein CpaB
MGARRILVLVIAVAVAGATAMFARSWIDGRPTVAVAAPQPQDIHEVLVADVTLPAGTFVKPQQLRWQHWPTDDVPSSYFLREQRTEQELVGAVVRRGIAAGEPITDGGVVKPGDRGFLAAVLSPGMRAVSVPITPISGNAGLIFPGDRVDMILTQTISGEDVTRRVSETVLNDIRVIAMGVATDDNAEEGQSNDSARTATLEVTPRQAEEVTLITELGKLSLSLRSLASGEDATDQANEFDGIPTYTWDSDVSQVLSKADSFSNRLLVLRGRSAQNVDVSKGSN